MAKKVRGEINAWYDEKGYGFISTPEVEHRIFVHIKDFASPARRPVQGDRVVFSLSTDPSGRARAVNATLAGLSAKRRVTGRTGTSVQIAAISFLVTLAMAGSTSAISRVIPAIYLVASSVTYVAYAIDKSAATSGRWRTPEGTLHVFALIGGWPGAMLAQARLRHKTRKQPFRTVFWFTVVLNCALLAWSLSPTGRGLLGSAPPEIRWSEGA